MKRRIAIISDNASPLTDSGNSENRGQSMYVAQTAKNLALLGYEVDIFTRRDSNSQPEIFNWCENVRVIHVPAGPAHPICKNDLLKLMPQFTSYMIRFFRQKRYHIVHANFFQSGLVALNLKRTTETPFVMTFHGLGRVIGTAQNIKDEFPGIRFEIEDRIVREADYIIAECSQDKKDLMYLYDAMPERIKIVPGGFDANWKKTVSELAAIYEEVIKKTPVPLSETVKIALHNLKQTLPKHNDLPKAKMAVEKPTSDSCGSKTASTLW